MISRILFEVFFLTRPVCYDVMQLIPAVASDVIAVYSFKPSLKPEKQGMLQIVLLSVFALTPLDHKFSHTGQVFKERKCSDFQIIFTQRVIPKMCMI